MIGTKPLKEAEASKSYQNRVKGPLTTQIRKSVLAQCKLILGHYQGCNTKYMTALAVRASKTSE
jgi:hypothetical protein